MERIRSILTRNDEEINNNISLSWSIFQTVRTSDINESLLLHSVVTVASRSTGVSACYRCLLCQLSLYVSWPFRPLTSPFPLTFLPSSPPLMSRYVRSSREMSGYTSVRRLRQDEQTCTPPSPRLPVRRHSVSRVEGTLCTWVIKKKKKEQSTTKTTWFRCAPELSSHFIYLFFDIFQLENGGQNLPETQRASLKVMNRDIRLKCIFYSKHQRASLALANKLQPISFSATKDALSH